MKKIFYLSLFLFIFNSYSFAKAGDVFFIDINKIVNDSNVGSNLNKSLENKLKKELKKFSVIEENLKKEEKLIKSQSNILSKEELNDKIKDYRVKLTDYNKNKQNFQAGIAEEKIKSTNKLLKKLNDILTKYANENSISMIIQKDKIVIGKKELDITEKILKIFDNQVKKL